MGPNSMTWGEAMASAEESGDGKPVGNGDYNVRVDGAKAETSKAGNPMLTLVLKVTDDGPAKNGTVWERLTLTTKAAGIFFRGLAAYGISKEDVSRLPEPSQGGMEQLAGLLKERTARVRIKNDDYGPKVDRYLGPATPGSAPAPVPMAGSTDKIEPPAAPPAPPAPEVEEVVQPPEVPF